MDIKKSNLFTLFSNLTPSQTRELGKAIQSPFFNYGKEGHRLYNYLLKSKRADHGVLTGEAACKYVFPGQKTDLAKLRHIMTYLTRVILRLLVIHEVEGDEGHKRLLLASSLRKNNQDKLFLQAYISAKDYFDNTAPLSPTVYYYQLELHTEFYNYSISNRRQQNDEMQLLSDDLDLFFVTQKLKHACNVLSYKNIFKTQHQPDLLEEVLALIERKKMLANPLVNILYVNYICLNEPDNESNFEQLKKILLTQSEGIDTKELRDIFMLAINYYIKRINTGRQQYMRQVFEIYGAGLKQGIFEERGRLSPFTYKNVSAIAIGLKEYDWVAAFLEDYKSKLSEEVRDGFYAYCVARYRFAIADYEGASNLLREVEIKEQFTDLDARVLLIKTYFEMAEDNLLDYAIDNLKQQLKRKKLQTYHEEVYKNFAKMASKLLHLRPYDKQARENFVKQLGSMKTIAERDWLLQKVKQH